MILLRNKYLDEISKISEVYIDKVNSINDFNSYSMNMVHISLETILLIHKNKIDINLYEDSVKNKIKIYANLKQKGRKNYFVDLDIKTLLDIYRAFEELISDLFVYFYLSMPVFLLNAQKDTKLLVYYDEIFENSDILNCRENLIIRKVKEIIQSNNVIEIINKFEKIFRINSFLTKKEKEFLYVISKNRNVLIHNNGIINKIYIDDLKKYNIKPKFNLREKINKRISNVSYTHRIRLLKIGSKILTFLIKNEKQIVQNYNSKIVYGHFMR